MRRVLFSILSLLCGSTTSCVSQLEEFESSVSFSEPDAAHPYTSNPRLTGDSRSCPDASLGETCVTAERSELGPNRGAATTSCSPGTAPWMTAPAGHEPYDAGAEALDGRTALPEDDGGTASGGAASCEPCRPGEYCPGGAAPPQACNGETWDHDADPSTACAAVSNCPAGTYIVEAANSLRDVVCDACPSGSFSATANATQCTSWQTCIPGSYVRTAGTTTSDVICEGCASGTFSDSAGASACAEWIDCEPGQYVFAPGSSTSDRMCAACEVDEYGEGVNLGSCAAVSECPAGTVQSAAATETSPLECEVCARGTYCAGGQAEPVSCPVGTWDDDGDPATPCVSKTVCVAGQSLLSEGSTSSDRSCTPCSDGTFSTTMNAVTCQTWRTCAAGTYVSTAGTLTRDRACSPCPEEQFSSSINSESCTPWSTCSAPDVYQTEAPSATSDRECAACTPPTRTTSDNDTICSRPAFQMVAGRVVIEAEHYHGQASNGSSVTWSELAVTGASAERCMVIGPDNGGIFWTEDPTTTAPRLDYDVNFTTTGTFYLFLRGAAENAHGNSDSCWAGVDDEWLQYSFNILDDQWDWIQAAFVINSPGVHTISVWGREDGFRLDKLVLQLSAAAPVGQGPPESSQQ